MSNRHRNLSETKHSKSLLGVYCLMFALICLFGQGCRRDMQDQPKMKPYRGSSFFRDGLSGRQPVEGTVARGYLREDTAFFTGKKSGAAASGSAQPSTTSSTIQNAFPDDVDTFPFVVNEDVVNRGQERYDIFCAVCHGKTGNGDG